MSRNHDFYLNLVDSKGRKELFKTVTNSLEFMNVKLNVLELLISQWDNTINIDNKSIPYLHIDDYNLHRAFIVSNNKIVSFGFGLNVVTNGNHIESFRIKNKEFKAKQISESHAILNEYTKKDDNEDRGKTASDKENYNLYHDISDDDLEEIPSKDGKYLFEFLLFEEPSYIRYDFDKKTKSEMMHPVCHFDLSFTPTYTYKIGLPRQIEEEELQLILNKKEFCRKLNLRRDVYGLIKDFMSKLHF